MQTELSVDSASLNSISPKDFTTGKDQTHSSERAKGLHVKEYNHLATEAQKLWISVMN